MVGPGGHPLAKGFARGAEIPKFAAETRIWSAEKRKKSWESKHSSIIRHYADMIIMFRTSGRGINFKERYDQALTRLKGEALEAYVKLKALEKGLKLVYNLSFSASRLDGAGDLIDDMSERTRGAIATVEGLTDRDVEFDLTISFRGGNQISNDRLMAEWHDGDWWKDQFLYGPSPLVDGVFTLKLDPKFFPIKTRVRLRACGLSYSCTNGINFELSAMVTLSDHDGIVPRAFLNEVKIFNYDRPVAMQAGTLLNADPFRGNGLWKVQIGRNAHHYTHEPIVPSIRRGPGMMPELSDIKLHLRLVGRE